MYSLETKPPGKSFRVVQQSLLDYHCSVIVLRWTLGPCGNMQASICRNLELGKTKGPQGTKHTAVAVTFSARV